MTAATTTALSAGGMGATSVDIALIHKLTSIADVTRLLHETQLKERSIDTELDKLLGKRADLERSFLLLNTPTAETLELVHADCEQLLSSTQSTAALADHISSKVRRLDLVQTHVQDVLGKINLILDRTNCINGVQSAMESEDYEAAASYISTFLDLETRLSAGGMAQQLADVGQAESQRQVLMEAKARLEVVVDQRFDDAVARRDQAAAVRFARLYKPLGKQDEGLKRFTEFMKLCVAGAARQNYATVSEQLDSGKRVDYAAALTLLFKDIALALEDNTAFVRDTFGSGALLELASGLQTECDAHGPRLLQRFLESRRVGAIVKDVTNRRRNAAPASGGGGEGGVDHRSVEGVLQELLRLCQLAEEYNMFMLGKMRDAAGGPLSVARETSYKAGAFNVCVRELLGHYIALEEFYMDETVAMAIRIDEVVPDSLTSSMVDDVFFILRKCGMRALATANMQAVCALLGELNNVLANSFRNALQYKLAPGPGKLLALASADGASGAAAPPAATSTSQGMSSSSASQSANDYAVALNNSDVAAEYVGKLRVELEGHLNDMFASAGDKERVRSVLADLAKTAGDFRQTNTRALDQVGEALMPRMRPALDEVASVSYQLSESEYAARELEESWTHRMLGALEGSVSWMQQMMTVNNYEGLVHLLLDKLVARLEALLSRKTFNQLGGLQLDRDCRMLVGHLSEVTSRTVRDKFARLNQMALVLGLESTEELMDYWGGDASGAVTWRLSPAEIRAVLAQRTDFSREAIMALPLQ